MRPLPAFLAKAVRDKAAGHGTAATLADLFGRAAPGRHHPLDADREGRLRCTASRVRLGLAALALELGIDRYYAALVTGSMALVPRSRFFYVRSEPAHYLADLRLFFEAIGWGPPACPDTVLPFGSQAVPSEANLIAAHRILASRAEQARPGRRYALAGLIEHHNHYVLAASWLLVFCIGGRQQTWLDFSAARCTPGVDLMEYGDKASGMFKLLRPVMFCSAAREQVRLLWDHLWHLADRAKKLGLDGRTGWVRHLGSVLERRPVALLFTIDDEGDAVPLGTQDLHAALQPERQLVPNFGRHYWQTSFLRGGICSEDVDVWARHTALGVEPMSSTSVSSIDAARRRLCAHQDAELERLDLRPVQGLGRRVAA